MNLLIFRKSDVRINRTAPRVAQGIVANERTAYEELIKIKFLDIENIAAGGKY